MFCLQVLRWAVYYYIFISVFNYQKPLHHEDSQVLGWFTVLVYNFPGQAVSWQSLTTISTSDPVQICNEQGLSFVFLLN